MRTAQRSDRPELTLVLGGTGKTGRRVADRLTAAGVPVRIGSRSAEPGFDWHDRSTWSAVLEGVQAAYLAFYPDLAVPGACEVIRGFTDIAVDAGITRLVLLSGRGEEEAQRCEEVVQKAGAEWTILRASWFAQNFSETFMRDLILGGVVAFPVGDVGEPFIDAADIAEVAVAALTEDAHVGRLYELTGPRLLTFAEAVAEIARASGRAVSYVQITPEAFAAHLAEQGVPEDAIRLLDYLFSEVLDGRNSCVADGVQRALGREPRDFADYARDAAAAGAWPGEVQR